MTREAKGFNHAESIPIDTDRLPPNRPPGYSGHVPLAKFEFADTFGSTCTSCVDKFNESTANYAPAYIK